MLLKFPLIASSYIFEISLTRAALLSPDISIISEINFSILAGDS